MPVIFNKRFVVELVYRVFNLVDIFDGTNLGVKKKLSFLLHLTCSLPFLHRRRNDPFAIALEVRVQFRK